MKKLLLICTLASWLFGYSAWQYQTTIVTVSAKDPWNNNRFYVEANNSPILKYLKDEYKRLIRKTDCKTQRNIPICRYYFDAAMYDVVIEDLTGKANKYKIVLITSSNE